MADPTAEPLSRGTATPRGLCNASRSGRDPSRSAPPVVPRCLLFLLLLLLPAAAQPASAQTQATSPQRRVADHEAASRRIVVSLEERRLWLIDGTDTLMAAPVAIGRRETFRYGGQTFDWRTPRGERTILAKRRDPLWHVPQWHYFERASGENLQLVEIRRNESYPLADGSRLEVRGNDVVRVLDGQYWQVPQGREIIIDGVLFVPPAGTRQRRVPGVLGTRALDLGDGYLIHGTNRYNRTSVGNAASHGCIRMRTEDVEQLFDLVTEGTRVVIY